MMEDFLTERAEILEEDSVSASDELNSFESWDSLAVLSVAAMADSNFGVNISSKDINAAVTVGDLYHRILAMNAN